MNTPGSYVPEAEPRWFWWPRTELSFPCRPFLLGGDEYGRRTLGVRLPGGMLWLPLWRFRGWVRCDECGEWEPPEMGSKPHGDPCDMVPIKLETLRIETEGDA